MRRLGTQTWHSFPFLLTSFLRLLQTGHSKHALRRCLLRSNVPSVFASTDMTQQWVCLHTARVLGISCHQILGRGGRGERYIIGITTPGTCQAGEGWNIEKMFIHSYCCYASANSSPYTASLYKPALTEKSRRLLLHQPDVHTYSYITFALKSLIYLSLQIHCPRLTLKRTPQTSKCPKRIENNLIEIQAYYLLCQKWSGQVTLSAPGLNDQWGFQLSLVFPSARWRWPTQARCPEAASPGNATVRAEGGRVRLAHLQRGVCSRGVCSRGVRSRGGHPSPLCTPTPKPAPRSFPAAVSVTL